MRLNSALFYPKWSLFYSFGSPGGSLWHPWGHFGEDLGALGAHFGPFGVPSGGPLGTQGGRKIQKMGWVNDRHAFGHPFGSPNLFFCSFSGSGLVGSNRLPHSGGQVQETLQGLLRMGGDRRGPLEGSRPPSRCFL